MKYNDLDIENWKDCDLNTDSLWLIKERDKSGRHENIYHGNFVPQIPDQLIRRYTKKGETVFELFMGGGTTLYECEKLNRKYVGFDINPQIVGYVRKKMSGGAFENDFFIKETADTIWQRPNISVSKPTKPKTETIKPSGHQSFYIF